MSRSRVFRVRAVWAAGCLALLSGVPSGARAAMDPAGLYLTQDGRARVRVEKCGSNPQRMCGYVVWLKTPLRDGQPATDAYNPDTRKAGRPTLGHQIMLGLKPNDEGEYEGKIYNAENGKSYDVTIWAEGPGELKVKGCLAFLCSTQTWPKVATVEAGQLTGPTGSPTGPQPDPEWARTASPASAPKRDAKPKT